MDLIRLDQTRCVKCGRCAAVCPRGLIVLEPEWPQSDATDLCIACGQCVAVCPTAALDNKKTPLSSQISLAKFPAIDADTANHFLRSRRSIRCYKKMPVPRENLLLLMDIARFAPTGSNSQGLSFRVIEKPETLHSLTEQTVIWLEKQTAAGHPAAASYAQYANVYRKTGRDVILRGAPCLILGLASKSFQRGRENTHFSFAYVELYAPVLTLGTCWAGLFEAAAFSGFEPLIDLLGLPDDKSLTGAIMVGQPEFGFHRLTDRNSLNICFDTQD